jgi:hypothetical protein
MNDILDLLDPNDPISEGRNAYQNGLSLDENPYPLFSAENDEWALGWQEAAEEDQS